MTRPPPSFKLRAIALGLPVIFALARVLTAGESVPPPPPVPATSDSGNPVSVEPLNAANQKSNSAKGTAAAPGVAKKSGDKNLAPAQPSAADIMSGMDWSATKQSFLEDRGAVVLSGSAWVRYTGVKLEADNIVFYRETREMYAEGHVRMKAGESEMQASSAYIDVDSDSGFLVDAVVKLNAPPESFGSGQAPNGIGIPQDHITQQEKDKAARDAKRSIVQGDENTSLRTRDPYGTYVDITADPQARATMLLKAEKLIRHSKLHYTTENAFVTNDEMAHPMYGMKTGTLDFYMHDTPDPLRPGKTLLKPEKIIAQRAQIQIMGFNLFPFPTITYDMTKKREYLSAHGGKSNRWGYYALTRIGYGLGSTQDEVQTKPFEFKHVYLDLDERQKRGPGVGFDLGWQTAGYLVPGCGTDRTTYERGMGNLRVYGEDEVQISTFDDVIRARQNLLRRIQLKESGRPRVEYDANLLFLARRRLDNAGPPSIDLQTHENDWRGVADFNHHQPIRRVLGIEGIQLDFVLQRETDRDFKLEYEPHNYNTQNQSEALVSARKACDNWSTELLYRTNPENFDGSPPRSPFDYGTFSGYEPALTYTRVPTEVGFGVFMSGEAEGARMKRYFERDIYDQPNFESDRVYAKIDFSRPFKLFCINLTPHLGGQGALYDNSRDNENLNNFVGNNGVKGKSISQGALKYGFDIDSRIYGTFCDLENEALGIKGLRHVVEPIISYRGTSSTLNDPVKVLDFDEIDNLQHSDRIRVGVDQTFQTHKPAKEGDGERTISLAGFDTSLDYFPNGADQKRLLSGDSFALMNIGGFINVLDVVRFDGSLGINPGNFRTEVANYGITIDTHERWRLKFDERFTYSDHARAIVGSDQYRLRFEYELSDRWRLAYEQVHEARASVYQNKGRQIERAELTRHYGPFDASIAYSVNTNLNDHGFYGSVKPTIVARNLILPENDPLVNPSQLSGDFDEPETRNFDPFEILRKSRLGKAPTGKSVNDVPAPPPPGAPTSQNTNLGSSAEIVDLGKLPGQTPAKPKKAPVDADEWTLPASTQASARDK